MDCVFLPPTPTACGTAAYLTHPEKNLSTPSTSSQRQQEDQETSVIGECSNDRTSPSTNTTNLYDDDQAHIYTNLMEMAELNNKPEPPYPDVADKPLRSLNNGWQEYMCETGRSYFFHSETGRSQWNPPRFLRSPAQVEAFLAARAEDLESSPSSSSSFSSPALDQTETGKTCVSESEVQPVPVLNNTARAHSEAPDKRTPRVSYFDGGHTKSDVMSSSFTSLRDRRSSLKHVAVPLVPTLPPIPPGSVSEESEGSADSRLDVVSQYTVEGGPSKSVSFDEMEPLRTIRCGNMDKCYDVTKKKVRKHQKLKEWVAAFMYLSSAHLIIYKDEKSAEKHGKHYAAPLGVCDLKGATVAWGEQREKKKRRIIELTLSTNSKVFLRTTTDVDTEEWYDALKDVIRKLPAGAGVGLLDHSSALVRTPSMAGSRSTTNGTLSESAVETSTPLRESVIERLKRFFRTRPSMESLKEKGIYKHEAVFGSTLSAICQQDNALVPKFIRIVTELIEAKGLDTDGIYRVSGNLSSIQKIRCQIDQDKYNLLVSETDVHVLSGALKLFFRELAESVFPAYLTKLFLVAIKLSGKQRLKRFDELLKDLPAENKETLKFLLRHLHRVAARSSQNRMQIHNLAIVFGPTLFTSEEPKSCSTVGKRKDERGAKSRLASHGGSSLRRDKREDKEQNGPALVQSNSTFAYNLIMQGQIVELLLSEQTKLETLKGPVQVFPP